MVSMYKIVKVYKNGIIKLPADVRREAGLDEGDELLVLVRDRRIVLIPRGVFDPVEVYASKLERVDEDSVFEEGVKDLRRLIGRIG